MARDKPIDTTTFLITNTLIPQNLNLLSLFIIHYQSQHSLTNSSLVINWNSLFIKRLTCIWRSNEKLFPVIFLINLKNISHKSRNLLSPCLLIFRPSLIVSTLHWVSSSTPGSMLLAFQLKQINHLQFFNKFLCRCRSNRFWISFLLLPTEH